MNLSALISIPVLAGEVFVTLPEPIRVYVRYLDARVEQLETRVHALKARLSKDSSNSSKPASSDELKRKPKTLRERSDKKPGGQQGRVGKGLARISNPDVIVTHTSGSCNECGSDFDDVQSRENN